MLKFLLGVIVGEIIGFAVCAIFRIAGTDEPQVNNLHNGILLLIGVIATFLLILLVFGLVSLINDFSQELRYINCEIKRTTGAERRHWIRKRRRLWLSLIPFVKY